MTAYLENNETEGPEGYFVQASAGPRAAEPRAAERDRQARAGGRRLEDAELRRTTKRLTLVNAMLGALLVAGLVMAATAKLE